MSDDWEGRHHDHSTEVDPSWAVAQLVARNYTLAAILTDLIAELRAEHYPHPCTDPEDFPCCCESCAGAWPCLMADMADRAEERLREVTGDE